MKLAKLFYLNALKNLKSFIKDLDIVSYVLDLGLGPCLGAEVVARSLGLLLNIPIYPVNHAIGHIELGSALALVILFGPSLRSHNASCLLRWRVSFWTNSLINLVGRLILHLHVEISKNWLNLELCYTTIPRKGNDVFLVCFLLLQIIK